MELPLKGIRVIELATIAAAPAAARILADYGAEVIKVESMKGDPVRFTGPFMSLPGSDECNPLFTVMNAGKELAAVDIKTPEGREMMYRLLSEADVFITNNRVEALKRSGLDYDTVREKNPRLIYAHFSGFGVKGPEGNTPGFDASAFWMRTGPFADWQTEGSFPMNPAYGFGDLATASTFVSGIMIALYAREKTGKGTMVRTSLYGSGVWCNGVSVISTQEPFCLDVHPKPFSPTQPFWHYYRCKDGVWMGVFCKAYLEDHQRYAEVFGVSELLKDPVFFDPQSMPGSPQLKECVERISEVVAKKDSTEWAEILGKADIPYQFAVSTSAVSKDEQAFANGYIENVEFPDGQAIVMPCYPLEFTEYDKRRYATGGSIGRDTDSVLMRIGCTPEQIEKMREAGIIF